VEQRLWIVKPAVGKLQDDAKVGRQSGQVVPVLRQLLPIIAEIARILWLDEIAKSDAEQSDRVECSDYSSPALISRRLVSIQGYRGDPRSARSMKSQPSRCSCGSLPRCSSVGLAVATLIWWSIIFSKV
jgi:hypothetical protein